MILGPIQGRCETSDDICASQMHACGGTGSRSWRMPAAARETQTVPNGTGRFMSNVGEIGGRDRVFLTYVPQNLKPNAPLLIMFHGGGGDGPMARLGTGGVYDHLADRDGFVVVYPYGIGSSWNTCRKAQSNVARRWDVDDIGFVEAIIEQSGESLRDRPQARVRDRPFQRRTDLLSPAAGAPRSGRGRGGGLVQSAGTRQHGLRDQERADAGHDHQRHGRSGGALQWRAAAGRRQWACDVDEGDDGIFRQAERPGRSAGNHAPAAYEGVRSDLGRTHRLDRARQAAGDPLYDPWRRSCRAAALLPLSARGRPDDRGFERARRDLGILLEVARRASRTRQTCAGVSPIATAGVSSKSFTI